MAIAKPKMVWVTANRSFVGGPEIGFTLLENHCYQIPENLARNFAAEKMGKGGRGWVTIGKENRAKERQKRKVLK